MNFYSCSYPCSSVTVKGILATTEELKNQIKAEWQEHENAS